MDIAEIREKKVSLEDAILGLINEFRDSTGLDVVSALVNRFPEHCQAKDWVQVSLNEE